VSRDACVGKRNQGDCWLCRCPEDNLACLDFHHVDESEKEEQITTIISYGYGRDKILDEMAKCEVICANCHRKEHFTPPDV